MKRFIALIVVFVMLFAFVGCVEESAPTADRKQQIQSEALMTEVNNRIGLPYIYNFTEKDLLKDIYELCDDADLITYTYETNLEGKKIFIGTTIGFGIPYSVQFSNPYKMVKGDLGQYDGTVLLPQAEPNGIFKPEGLSATWVILINETTGEREATYVESEISVYQSKVPAYRCAEWSLPDNY